MWFLTFLWSTMKVLWWIIISPTKVPTGIHRVKQKLIQIQQSRIGTRRGWREQEQGGWMEGNENGGGELRGRGGRREKDREGDQGRRKRRN
jgi:hypothetical protein